MARIWQIEGFYQLFTGQPGYPGRAGKQIGRMRRTRPFLAIVTVAKEEIFELAFQCEANLIAQAGALGVHDGSL